MRIEGWERRLDAVIEAARAQPYQLGQHDCFTVACAAVQALTLGGDLFARWRGTYSTKDEAHAKILEHAATFTEFFSNVFGVLPSGVKLARRGDIVEYFDGLLIEKHLGVCLGERTALLGERGLIFLPTLECNLCWRID